MIFFSFYRPGPKHLVSYNERFVIYDTKDKMLFYADENEVIIGAKKVTFTGKKNKYCPYSVLLLSPFG